VQGAHPRNLNHVAAGAISAATGEELSHTALWKLRTGRSANPTLKTITALAAFFRVPPSYFTDGPDAEDTADQVAMFTMLRDAGISGTGLRALTALTRSPAAPSPTSSPAPGLGAGEAADPAHIDLFTHASVRMWEEARRSPPRSRAPCPGSPRGAGRRSPPLGKPPSRGPR